MLRESGKPVRNASSEKAAIAKMHRHTADKLATAPMPILRRFISCRADTIMSHYRALLMRTIRGLRRSQVFIRPNTARKAEKPPVRRR